MLINIGALWLDVTKPKKGSPKGDQYLKGRLEWKGETIYLRIFMNKKKDIDSKPDYIIYQHNVDKGGGESNE